MKPRRPAESLLPLNELETSPSKVLRAAESGPTVITVNGKAAGVVLTPADDDRLVEADALHRAIDEGIAAADAGEVLSTREVRERLGLPPR